MLFELKSFWPYSHKHFEYNYRIQAQILSNANTEFGVSNTIVVLRLLNKAL